MFELIIFNLFHKYEDMSELNKLFIHIVGVINILTNVFTYST